MFRDAPVPLGSPREWPSVTETVTKAELLEIAHEKLSRMKTAYEAEEREYSAKLSTWREQAQTTIMQIIDADQIYEEDITKVIRVKPQKPYWSSRLESRIRALETLPDGPIHHLLRAVLDMSYGSLP